MRRRRLRSRHRQGRAAFDIEIGAVPRAGNRAGPGIQFPFTQRATIVRAHVVQRIKLAANSEQHDQPIVDFHQHFTGVGEFGQFGDANEFGHGKKELRFFDLMPEAIWLQIFH
jgi:hypothetical protein